MLDASGISGTPDQLGGHVRGLERRGVERLYVWFTDFADPASIRRFGTDVIPAFT
jgi:hypothetical protein